MMEKNKVFLTEKIHPFAVEHLSTYFEVVQGTSVKEAEIVRQAQDCEGILIRSATVTGAMMSQLPKLKVVAKHGIGVDNIDVKAAAEQGILVVNAPFSNLNAVAEHTLTMLMALSKNLVHLDQKTRAGKFAARNQYVNAELQGKTLGLIGFGRIARMLAKKVSGFEMQVLAADPFADAEEAKRLGAELVSQEELLAKSDFVSLHVPLMPNTNKMVNREFLKAMKPSAVIVNASRGPVIDEEALTEALRSGEIKGAGLDVFDPEPPQVGNPLLELENVIVSPHNAALTDEALLAMAMDSAQGIIDYLGGARPKYPVNQEVLPGILQMP